MDITVETDCIIPRHREGVSGILNSLNLSYKFEACLHLSASMCWWDIRQVINYLLEKLNQSYICQIICLYR